MVNFYIILCRAGGDGGLGELLKLEPIKEASHSPPSVKNSIIKPTTSPPPTYESSTSSQNHVEPVSQECDTAIQRMNDRASGAKGSFKSPTGILAGDLDKNLLIKSPPTQTPKLTALPKHMQAAKMVKCKGSSLLTSTAMRFQSGNDGLNSILDRSPDPIPGK